MLSCSRLIGHNLRWRRWKHAISRTGGLRNFVFLSFFFVATGYFSTGLPTPFRRISRHVTRTCMSHNSTWRKCVTLVTEQWAGAYAVMLLLMLGQWWTVRQVSSSALPTRCLLVVMTAWRHLTRALCCVLACVGRQCSRAHMTAVASTPNGTVCQQTSETTLLQHFTTNCFWEYFYTHAFNCLLFPFSFFLLHCTLSRYLFVMRIYVHTQKIIKNINNKSHKKYTVQTMSIEHSKSWNWPSTTNCVRFLAMSVLL